MRASLCIDHHQGQEIQGQTLAKQMIDSFADADLDAIIINAAGCGHTLKEYDRIFADDSQYRKPPNEKIKASPLTGADKREVEERAAYARNWLQTHAPEAYRFELQETLPEAAHSLTDAQKAGLKILAGKLATISEYDGQTIHTMLHETKEESGLEPKDFFSALYLIFLNKDSGPKAGWFLSTLDKEFVIERLTEADM